MAKPGHILRREAQTRTGVNIIGSPVAGEVVKDYVIIPPQTSTFVIMSKIGKESAVLYTKTLTTSRKFRPILLLASTIPVSDINTNCVKASTPMKKRDASDADALNCVKLMYKYTHKEYSKPTP